MNKTIEWLIRQVNDLLDGCCGCNNSTSSLPMYVKWGRQSESETAAGIETTRDFQITSSGLTTFNGTCDLLKITFPTEVWNEIQDKQPTLLLDRYRGKSMVKAISPSYRKAGYRHEPQIQAEANGRNSEVLLTENGDFADFQMENYFILDNLDRVRAKGFARERSQTRNSRGGGVVIDSPGAFINFGLRLRLTDGTDVVETNYLGYFKAVFHYVRNNPATPVNITYRPI